MHTISTKTRKILDCKQTHECKWVKLIREVFLRTSAKEHRHADPPVTRKFRRNKEPFIILATKKTLVVTQIWEADSDLPELSKLLFTNKLSRYLDAEAPRKFPLDGYSLKSYGKWVPSIANAELVVCHCWIDEGHHGQTSDRPEQCVVHT